MAAAGTRSRHRVGRMIFVDCMDFCGWSYTQVFDVGPFATRSKAGSRQAEAIAKGTWIVVSHLSKTACVQTHFRDDSVGFCTERMGPCARCDS